MNEEKLEVPTSPFFVAGTPQEAERIRGEGYEAIAGFSYDPDSVAIEAAHGGSGRRAGTAILALSEEGAEAWRAAFDAAALPCLSVDATSYAAAFQSGEVGELAELLRGDYERAVSDAEAMREEARARALSKAHVHDAMSIAMSIFGGEADREPISTGLKNLDGAIGGGLPSGGLTVLGAGSSSGKTTLCLQIADHIAASGRDVLFVTIEQSRFELVSKSLSRLMRQTKKPSGGHYVASATHITSLSERAKWSKDKLEVLLSCCTWYTQNIAPHMHIMELDGQPSMKDIRAAFEAVKACCTSGKAPVLVVDYLQLIRAKDERMSDRRAVDVNVMELRQLAKKKKTAVVVISSINRQSYSEGASMEAFKESGTIEFSADVALILQPRNFNKKTGGTSTERQGREKAREAMAEHKGRINRACEVVVLKNRGGAMPKEPVALDFDAMCNLFTEGSEGTEEGRRQMIVK